MRIGPGAIQLTVIPCGPRSRALACASPMTALFVAEYELRAYFEPSPRTEEM